MKKINTKTIISSLFYLGFDKVDSILFTYVLGNLSLKKEGKYFIFKEDEIALLWLKKYFSYNDGIYQLRDGYLIDTDPNTNRKIILPSGKILADENDFLDSLSQLDFSEIVLKKVNDLNNPNDILLQKYFSSKEMEIIKELINEGYLIEDWEEQAIYDDYHVIKLTDLGKVRLFKLNNKRKIDAFIEQLESKGYDTSLLDDFLIVQDLSLPIPAILNLENLEIFCSQYDRAMEGNSKTCHIRQKEINH